MHFALRVGLMLQTWQTSGLSKPFRRGDGNKIGRMTSDSDEDDDNDDDNEDDDDFSDKRRIFDEACEARFTLM